MAIEGGPPNATPSKKQTFNTALFRDNGSLVRPYFLFLGEGGGGMFDPCLGFHDHLGQPLKAWSVSIPPKKKDIKLGSTPSPGCQLPPGSLPFFWQKMFKQKNLYLSRWHPGGDASNIQPGIMWSTRWAKTKEVNIGWNNSTYFEVNKTLWNTIFSLAIYRGQTCHPWLGADLV